MRSIAIEFAASTSGLFLTGRLNSVGFYYAEIQNHFGETNSLVGFFFFNSYFRFLPAVGKKTHSPC